MFYGQTSPILTFLLEITDAMSSVLKRRETFQRVISVQFKSQHLWSEVSESEKWSESDIRPSMVTHTRNSCSAFNPSKVHTHSSEHTHTHTVNTHPEQWAAIYAAAPGEQLGVRCLAQGQLSRGIEGGESAGHSLPPPTIPAGPGLELATFGLRVRLSNH